MSDYNLVISNILYEDDLETILCLTYTGAFIRMQELFKCFIELEYIPLPEHTRWVLSPFAEHSVFWNRDDNMQHGIDMMQEYLMELWHRDYIAIFEIRELKRQA